MSQASLFSQSRARARRTDPETSYWAAEGIDVTATQAKVLRAFIHGPATDHQLWLRLDSSEATPPTPQSVRSRRSELVAKGLVKWTGEYGVSEHGGKARIWSRT